MDMEHDATATAAAAQPSHVNGHPSLNRALRPSDLPAPKLFEDFEEVTTITLPSGVRQSLKTGRVTQINNVNAGDVKADIAVLPKVVNRSSVEDLLKILRSTKLTTIVVQTCMALGALWQSICKGAKAKTARMAVSGRLAAAGPQATCGKRPKGTRRKRR